MQLNSLGEWMRFIRKKSISKKIKTIQCSTFEWKKLIQLVCVSSSPEEFKNKLKHVLIIHYENVDICKNKSIHADIGIKVIYEKIKCTK